VSARKGFPSPKPLARLLPLLAPYRTRLAVAFVCLLVAAAAGLVFPLVLRFLLDAAFEQRTARVSVRWRSLLGVLPFRH
jgi:ABC-type multidrug transport system fused ATPase/permease subunit